MHTEELGALAIMRCYTNARFTYLPTYILTCNRQLQASQLR